MDEIDAILNDWLAFSADVQPHDAAGTEWLDILRAKTMQALAVARWTPEAKEMQE